MPLRSLARPSPSLYCRCCRIQTCPPTRSATYTPSGSPLRHMCTPAKIPPGTAAAHRNTPVSRIMEVRAHPYLRVRCRRYRSTASVLPFIRIRAKVHHRRRSHVTPARVQKLHRDPLDSVRPVVVALRVPRYRVRFQPSPERVRITLLPSYRYRLVDPFLLLRVITLQEYKSTRSANDLRVLAQTIVVISSCSIKKLFNND